MPTDEAKPTKPDKPALLRLVEPLLASIRRWRIAVYNAFIASFGDIVFALALAYVAFWISDSLKLATYLRQSVWAEHVGIAFVVAAIAVFGYEYKSRRIDRFIARAFAGDDAYLVTLRRSLIEALMESYRVVKSDVPH